jgi:hypothetical protein
VRIVPNTDGTTTATRKISIILDMYELCCLSEKKIQYLLFQISEEKWPKTKEKYDRMILAS